LDKVTKEIAIRLILFDCCKAPEVGSLIESFPYKDLLWAERILTSQEKEDLGRPLWTFSKYGDGDGAGYGAGYGYGYAGYGDGDGDGAGYGAGAGAGYGDGDGAGYGYGAGDGHGRGHDFISRINDLEN